MCEHNFTLTNLHVAEQALREEPYPRLPALAGTLAIAANKYADALAEVERLQGIVDRAYRKLSCVAIERSCKGVPEIVQACDKQAMGILSEAAEAGGK